MSEKSGKWIELRDHLILMIKTIVDPSLDVSLKRSDLPETGLADVAKWLAEMIPGSKEQRDARMKAMKDYCRIGRPFHLDEALLPKHLNGVLLRQAYIECIKIADRPEIMGPHERRGPEGT